MNMQARTEGMSFAERRAFYKSNIEALEAIRPLIGSKIEIDRLRGELSRAEWALNAITDRFHPLNRITRQHSAFEDFADLLNSHRTYRPTIKTYSADRECLADAYDAVREHQGDERRAYRYSTGHKVCTWWVEPITVENTGRPAWIGVYHDERLPAHVATRYTRPYDNEAAATMQAAGAAARINRKAAQVWDIASSAALGLPLQGEG